MTALIKSFSEETGLSLLTPSAFEEWRKNRLEGDELLKAASNISFNPFAVILTYGETSAQAFYWNKNRFADFWLSD